MYILNETFTARRENAKQPRALSTSRVVFNESHRGNEAGNSTAVTISPSSLATLITTDVGHISILITPA